MFSKPITLRLRDVRARALGALARLRWLPPLCARIAVGVLFASTGWGKVHHLEKVIQYFQTLHVPLPALNAPLVAWSELICGSLIVVGLVTRLATVPLMISMVVALLTAKAGTIHGLVDLVGQDELDYVVLLVYLAVEGAGALSLDAVIARSLDRSGAPVGRDGYAA